MRTFIAVEIPDDVKQNVMEYVKSVKGMFTRESVKWVSDENLHFTVKFLGDVPRSKFDAVKECVASATADFSPFRLGVSHPGFFS